MIPMLNMQWMQRVATARKDEFRVTFLTGTTPTDITLGAGYDGPGTASAALYDAGDGNWAAYTSHTITVLGSYVAFRGDWRTAGGIYRAMFGGTFRDVDYTCGLSGAFTETPSAFANCYRDMFFNGNKVTAMADNPIPNLTGNPGLAMYQNVFRNTGVSGAMPSGLMDLSGLEGTPSSNMLTAALQDSVFASGDILLGAGIDFTVSNVAGSLISAFRNMLNWTGQVKWGTDVLVDEIDPDAQTNAFTGSTNAAGYATMHPYWKGEEPE